MSWVAVGTSAIGAAGSALGGGGGAAMPGDSFAGGSTTFGSVNFKSAGAGDKGKSASTSHSVPSDSSEFAGSGYGSAGVPKWVYWIAAGVVAILSVFLFLRRRK